MAYVPPKMQKTSALILGSQLCTSSLVLAAALLAPPAEGTMLAIPMAPALDSHAARWATQAGGKIIGTGRIAGSFVITGRRDEIFAIALRHGTLIVAAPKFLCESDSGPA